MKKSLVPIVVVVIASLGGCAAPPQPAGTQSAAAGQSGGAQRAAAQSTGNGRTVWVSPPVGSLLGGGYARVASDSGTNDEPGLISAINALNAAAGSKQERPFVLSAVARVSGLSEQQVQRQQDQMQVRFGELLAFNTIARKNESKVRELAGLKARGKTWSELTRTNAISMATVAQTVRNANDFAADSFSSNAERESGGDRKLHDMGVRPQVRPGG